MPVVRVQDIETFYEVGGSGPPLVLVTGLAGVASFWKPNLAALERHFTVFRYDQRGTGRTTRKEGEYSVDVLAEDLAGLLRSLGIANAALLGHSTGGAIGQILAARHPELVDRLVLYGTWATLCPQMRLCLELRQSLLLALGVEHYHRASPLFLYPPPYICEHADRIDAETALAICNSSSVAILDARIRAIMAFDGSPYLGDIRAPTLVTVARDDILTPPLASQELVQAIRGARFAELSYGGHAASTCVPEAFHDIVLPFLRQSAHDRV